MKKKIKKILTIVFTCILVIAIFVVGYGIKENARINKIVKSHNVEQISEQNNVLENNIIILNTSKLVFNRLC